MKISKKANQANFVINNEYHSLYDLNEMLKNDEIFYFNDRYCRSNDKIDNYDVTCRIYASRVNEVKVKLDNYGYYTTVAVGLNGKEYYISL